MTIVLVARSQRLDARKATANDCRGSFVVDAEDPGDADEAFFDAHFDVIADVKAVEILARHGEALDSAAFAPRSDDELMDGQNAWNGEAADDGGFNIARNGAIQGAINEKESAEQPRDEHEAVKNVLEQFDFLAANRASLRPHGERDGDEKNNAEENEDAVELERRIEKARNKKRDGAEEKNSQSVYQAAAHSAACFGTIQPTIFADGGSEFRAAIRTAHHG